ncbi:S-adenosylmethionine decarboxylase [Candidatus Woesebacteria bacterium]|nr:S-adenosylmethionine decarboxylase [Candidatus Woesebacteria bacterium]
MKTSTDRKNFGLHLMIDAYLCDPKVLDDEQKLLAFLNDTPDKLDMTKLTDPKLIHAEGNGVHDPGGWTGFVIIAESHISLHTFVKRQFLTLDIYSCKNFETEEIVKYIQKFFGAQDMDVFVQERGVRYPSEDLF